MDETGHLDRKICPQHEKGLELFCRSDQMCICVLCTVKEHRSHNITSAEEERIEKQVSPISLCVNVWEIFILCALNKQFESHSN